MPGTELTTFCMPRLRFAIELMALPNREASQTDPLKPMAENIENPNVRFSVQMKAVEGTFILIHF